jgi:hypothetical protein
MLRSMGIARPGARLVTAIGSADPFWTLLDDPALVLAADPCPAHLHRARFELAALQCLSRREFLAVDRPAGRARLYGRVRWMLPADSAAWWDGRLAAPEPAGFHLPIDPDGFDALKIRANRLQIVPGPLAALLARLPDGFADEVRIGDGCGEDRGVLEREAARVRRPVPVPSLRMH